MLRLLGALLIISGTWGLGLGYLEKKNKRIQTLERWEYIFNLFQSEITFKKQPLPLAGREVGIKIGGDEGRILKKIGEEMESGKGMSFSKIWTEEWKEYLKESCLTKEEQEQIMEFALFTGFEEKELQENMIEVQKDKVKTLRIKVQEENREKQRIVMLLSSCAGILLVLILW